ncbi:hypothetical protein [Bradyrhizobium sp. 190]|uniref:hypothetical protein n=1 Tax=Bradyrhizobium sp. 190 TaxID=2782658 RepID=UPI0035ABD524
MGRAPAELLGSARRREGRDLQPQGRPCHESTYGIRKAGGDAHVGPFNIARRNEVEARIAGATKANDIMVCTSRWIPIYGPLFNVTRGVTTRSWARTSREISGFALAISPDGHAQQEVMIIPEECAVRCDGRLRRFKCRRFRTPRKISLQKGGDGPSIALHQVLSRLISPPF